MQLFAQGEGIAPLPPVARVADDLRPDVWGARRHGDLPHAGGTCYGVVTKTKVVHAELPAALTALTR
jgi:hypothetical protein